MTLSRRARELIVKDIAEVVSKVLDGDRSALADREYIESQANNLLIQGDWLELDPDNEDDVRIVITIEKEVAEYILG